MNPDIAPRPTIQPTAEPTLPSSPNSPVTPNPQPQSFTPPPTQPIQPKPFKKPKKLLWLLLVILLIAAAVGGYLYYKNNNKTVTPVAQTNVKKDIPLIRFGTADGPVNVFYPSKDIINVSGMQLVNTQIFEGLVGWQGGTKLVPLLATSWTNPDDSSWVFTLRNNVKFHTGRTMAAEDVKYSLDKFKDVTYGGAFGSTIKEVSVLSPSQVKITTKGPDPLLLNRLANLYIIDSKATKPIDSANGTGPYVVKTSTDPVKDKLTDLVAYDGYWGGHAYTRELQFSQIVKESAEVAALKDKKIDIFDLLLDKASIDELKAANIPVINQQGLAVTAIYFNTLKTGSPLGNLKFRQALNLGINRAAIIKAANVDGAPIGQYMVSVVPGYVPKLKPTEQDVTKAKALITQSGVKSPSLTLSYGSGSSNQSLLTEFQKEAAALDITIKLNPIDDLNTLINKYLDGKTDMFFASNSSTLFDGSDILSAFQTPGVYENTKADKLLGLASQTLDGSKHLAFLQQAAIELDNDAAGIPLYSRTAYFAQASKAYTITADIPGVNGGGYFWKVYQH